MKLLEKEVEMTCRGVAKRSDNSKDWDKRAFHFEVIVTIDDQAIYSGPYSVGHGVVVDWLKRNKPRMCKGMFNLGAGMTIADSETLEALRINSIQGKSTYHGFGGSIPGFLPVYMPDVSDVLESLFMDAVGIDAFTSFEDWAGDMGVDTDSIRWKRVFQSCHDTAMKLRAIFGTEFDKAMEELELL